MLVYVTLGIAFAMTAAATAAWVTRFRAVMCPRCGVALAIDPDGRSLQRVPGVRGMSRAVEAYRCAGCGGEYRQLERGPLISLETWNAGADFPQARIHRTR